MKLTPAQIDELAKTVGEPLANTLFELGDVEDFIGFMGMLVAGGANVMAHKHGVEAVEIRKQIMRVGHRVAKSL